MKILITGAKGMLAQAVRERFAKDPQGKDNELILTDVVADEKIGSLSLDITDSSAVAEFIQDVKPELIINCAAYTNVDGAEQQKELAEKVNYVGPSNLALAAKKTRAVLVHVSTDYVFGGEAPKNHIYSEDDPKNPRSVYGITKLRGEEAIETGCEKYYIFRTAWLYGKGGKNFVKTMVEVGIKQCQKMEKGEGYRAEVAVVDDQFGSPTYTEDLTDIIYQAVYKNIPYGVYNATNEGFTCWADFTRKIYEICKIDCKVKGISSKEYEKDAVKKAEERGEKRIVAPRPKNSMMSKQKLEDAKVFVRDWEEALHDYLKEEQFDLQNLIRKAVND